MSTNKTPIVKNYQVESKDLAKKYTAITIADLHLVKLLNKNMLENINKYLKDTKDNLDFILLPGDLSSYKYYLDDRSFDYLKRVVDGFSVSADAPLYAGLGNHDFGIFGDKNEELIRKKFNELKNNSNIIPLDNKSISYDDEIEITGVTPNNEIYKAKTYHGENGRILCETLKDLKTKENKYNIALIHDPLSVYYASKINPDMIDKYNLIVSGHEHGGYLSAKQMERNKDGIGYIEYFKNFKPYLKIPCCYGMYKLTKNTDMIVTEGIKRYNGYIPSFIYTTPFITEISINSQKKSRK